METLKILGMLGMPEGLARWEKLWLGLILFGLLLWVGCSSQARPSFEGVFVNAAKSEFSEAADTLRVEKTAERNYTVYRSTGIILIDEQGKKGRPILEKEIWKMRLDEERRELVELSKGRVLMAEAHGLRLANAFYQRLP